MITEEWRPVIGYEGWYEASTLGRIRGIGRWISYVDGRKRFYRPRLRSTPKNDNGYRVVQLLKNKRRDNRLVHGIVMETFCGPRPMGAQVNHLNGVKGDNRVGNLEWATRSENIRHAYATGLIVKKRGRRDN